MSINAAEQEIRPIAVGRHSWTFAGSDEGGRPATAIYKQADPHARINDVDPPLRGFSNFAPFRGGRKVKNFPQ